MKLTAPHFFYVRFEVLSMLSPLDRTFRFAAPTLIRLPDLPFRWVGACQPVNPRKYVWPVRNKLLRTFTHGQSFAIGMANEPIAAAEARLGLVLPEPLRNFFAVAGGSQDLLNADYIFLPPEKLRVDDNHLIFCEERQGQEDFGIALANIAALGERPNPPVNVRPKGRVEWLVAEEGTLSAFLLGMTAWQVALMLPERARCPVPEVDLPKLLAFFEPVGAPLMRVGASRFGLIDRKRSIVAAYCCADEVLYLGTPHEDLLEKLEQKAGLELESL